MDGHRKLEVHADENVVEIVKFLCWTILGSLAILAIRDLGLNGGLKEIRAAGVEVEFSERPGA